jgi:hypothetical protein
MFAFNQVTLSQAQHRLRRAGGDRNVIFLELIPRANASSIDPWRVGEDHNHGSRWS